jgi:hypothetical protein
MCRRFRRIDCLAGVRSNEGRGSAASRDPFRPHDQSAARELGEACCCVGEQIATSSNATQNLGGVAPNLAVTE